MGTNQFGRTAVLLSALVIAACAPGRSDNIQTTTGDNNQNGNPDGGSNDAGANNGSSGSTTVSGSVFSSTFSGVSATTLVPTDGGFSAPVVVLASVSNICSELGSQTAPTNTDAVSIILVGSPGLTAGSYTVGTGASNVAIVTFSDNTKRCTASATGGSVTLTEVADGGVGELSGEVAVTFDTGNLSGTFTAPACTVTPVAASGDGGSTTTCN